MRYLLYASIFFCANTYAQVNATDILKQSSARIKQLKSIAYNVHDDAFGMQLSGDVIIQRTKAFPIFGVSKIRLMGMVRDQNGGKPISMSYDGNKFEFMDPSNYQVVRLDSPSYPRLSRTGQMLYSSLLEAAYFEKYGLDSLLRYVVNAVYLGDTSIYNSDCYKIEVHTERYNDIAGVMKAQIVWFIGKNDLLVHGRTSKYGKLFMKIKQIDKEYPDELFSLNHDANDSGSQSVKKITGLEPISTGMLTEGTAAPGWTLPSPTLKEVNLNKLREKVVLLDFWGTWCVPCIKAMPEIQAIYDHFKGKDVMVIGVSVEMEKTADPAAFMKRKGFTYPIVLNGHTITRLYKVVQFPSIYIIGKDGKIVHAEQGVNRENFKEDIIKRIERELR